MEKEWFTGGELLQELKLSSQAEILKYVCKGLQPYDEYMQQILPPGVYKSNRSILELQEERWYFLERFPGFEERDMTIEEQWISNHDRKKDETGRLEKVYYKDGSDSAIREEYQSIKVETQMLEEELRKYPKLPKWIGYECPAKAQDKKSVISLLVDSYFKREDILEFENEYLKKEANPDDIHEDPESFIRSLQVSYVSDTEIKISGGGKKAITYGMKELGFIKDKSKIWKEFIKILTSRDHFYHVGIARGANREMKKSYGVNRKVLVEINKRLGPFLNKTYQLQQTVKYNVYELIPNKKEAPGTYRFKFQIKNNSDADIKLFKTLPKDQLLQNIERLSEQYGILSNEGDEDAEVKINKILDQLSSAIIVAVKNEWITQTKAENYLNPRAKQSKPHESSIKDEDSDQEDSNQEE